jgi:hypothetical protein
MSEIKKNWSTYLSLALVISLFAWTAGFGLSIRYASAEGLTLLSDTLSDSDLGVVATHTIQYTNATATIAGQTIRITFDPTTDLFDGVGSLVTADISFTGATIVAACGGGGDEVTLTTSTAAGDESAIFTVCAGDTVASGTKTVVFNNKIANPTSTNSYIIRVKAGNQDLTDTRVAIIDDVVVTAAVETSFVFTISGLATSTALTNGATTTKGSTATTLAFGTLPLNSPVTMGQQLTVATNAANGFIVTVEEDQNLLSSTGADIDLFANANATTTPSAWASPLNVLDDENTYGHMGLTSDDSDLNSAEFGTSTPLFAGNIQASTTPRQVFSHTGPSDGTTQDKGMIKVAYRIQIASLQEAGNDYTNVLTYIATPTF